MALDAMISMHVMGCSHLQAKDSVLIIVNGTGHQSLALPGELQRHSATLQGQDEKKLYAIVL